jgi:hypothetical protein
MTFSVLLGVQSSSLSFPFRKFSMALRHLVKVKKIFFKEMYLGRLESIRRRLEGNGTLMANRVLTC